MPTHLEHVVEPAECLVVLNNVVANHQLVVSGVTLCPLHIDSLHHGPKFCGARVRYSLMRKIDALTVASHSSHVETIGAMQIDSVGPDI